MSSKAQVYTRAIRIGKHVNEIQQVRALSGTRPSPGYAALVAVLQSGRGAARQIDIA